MKSINKLVILDYETAKVHIYSVESPLTHVDSSFIASLGYNVDAVEWIVGDLEIINHNSLV